MLCSICGAENLDDANLCICCGLSLLDSILLLHLPPDSLLKNGQYKIESLLGQGGFGITYKGIYIPNGAEVAIKELWPQGARQGTKVSWPPTINPKEKTEQIASFIKEADNQSKCKHPNIAAVYDWFEENNTAYIVLQFVAGKSLYQIFQEQNILSEARVKKYFLQIAQALKVVHAQNFQHRDIKPDNILIDGNDQAILIDFGAAREFIAGQTKKLTILLTPGYAPLEQYTSVSKRYAATDLYAFCASMYELLTGQRPVDAAERNLASLDPLIPPRQLNPNISELMEKVILTGMKIKVEERFQTADELIGALNGNLILPSQRKAQELVKEGKLSEAARIYASCLRDDPSNGSAAIEYALLSIYLDDVQAAVAAETAIRLNPNNGRGYGVLGLVKCRQKNWPEAVQNLEQGAKLSPDLAWIQANLAWALGMIGNWKPAEQTVQKALKLDENCTFALGIKAWILFQQQKYKSTQVNEPAVIPCAIKALARSNATNSQPLQQWLYPYLITALSRVTHPINGNSLNGQIEKCLKQIPTHSFVLGFRGWQQANSGLLHEALVNFQKASQAPNAQSWILTNTAITHEYLGNLSEAIQVYEIYLGKIAQVPFLHYHLGRLLGRSQQWENAKSHLEEAIKLNNDYAEAYHNLGWVLLNHRQGKIKVIQEILGAYKAALNLYRKQNRHQLVHKIEQVFQAAEMPL